MASNPSNHAQATESGAPETQFDVSADESQLLTGLSTQAAH